MQALQEGPACAHQLHLCLAVMLSCACANSLPDHLLCTAHNSNSSITRKLQLSHMLQHCKLGQVDGSSGACKMLVKTASDLKHDLSAASHGTQQRVHIHIWQSCFQRRCCVCSLGNNSPLTCKIKLPHQLRMYDQGRCQHQILIQTKSWLADLACLHRLGTIGKMPQGYKAANC